MTSRTLHPALPTADAIRRDWRWRIGLRAGALAVCGVAASAWGVRAALLTWGSPGVVAVAAARGAPVAWATLTLLGLVVVVAVPLAGWLVGTWEPLGRPMPADALPAPVAVPPPDRAPWTAPAVLRQLAVPVALIGAWWAGSVLAALVVPVAWVAPVVVARVVVGRAMRMGRHDRAFRALRVTRPLLTPVERRALRGWVALRAGRSAFAESEFRALWHQTAWAGGRVSAACASGVGWALLHRDRRDARQAFEASVAAWPHAADALEGLAVAELRAGAGGPRALACVELALVAANRPVRRWVEPWRPAHLYALRAWALARCGEPAAAASALAVPADAVGPAWSRATVHAYRASAYELLYDEARAIEELERAARWDPAGVVGARARDRLASLGQRDRISSRGSGS